MHIKRKYAPIYFTITLKLPRLIRLKSSICLSFSLPLTMPFSLSKSHAKYADDMTVTMTNRNARGTAEMIFDTIPASEPSIDIAKE